MIFEGGKLLPMGNSQEETRVKKIYQQTKTKILKVFKRLVLWLTETVYKESILVPMQPSIAKAADYLIKERVKQGIYKETDGFQRLVADAIADQFEIESAKVEGCCILKMGAGKQPYPMFGTMPDFVQVGVRLESSLKTGIIRILIQSPTSDEPVVIEGIDAINDFARKSSVETSGYLGTIPADVLSLTTSGLVLCVKKQA